MLVMNIVHGEILPVEIDNWSPWEKEWLEQYPRTQQLGQYASINHLQFEGKLRFCIITAAKSLYQSGAQFAVFEKSRCNPNFWNRTQTGGFLLKSGVSPHQAIADIFINGQLYAFECATAIVIIMYRAISEAIGSTVFNQLFPTIMLHDWNFDQNLRLIQKEGIQYAQPGDVIYFVNPDVSMNTPEWQGENTIMLESNLYYGHGVGIKTKEEIIAELNRFRKPNSTVSAFQLNRVIHPDFYYYTQFLPQTRAESTQYKPSAIYGSYSNIYAEIGSNCYIRL